MRLHDFQWNRPGEVIGWVRKALGRNPVVALLGPRQCGKTTLARQMMPEDHSQYFDLEDPVTVRPLQECLAPR